EPAGGAAFGVRAYIQHFPHLRGAIAEPNPAGIQPRNLRLGPVRRKQPVDPVQLRLNRAHSRLRHRSAHDEAEHRPHDLIPVAPPLIRHARYTHTRAVVVPVISPRPRTMRSGSCRLVRAWRYPGRGPDPGPEQPVAPGQPRGAGVAMSARIVRASWAR